MNPKFYYSLFPQPIRAGPNLVAEALNELKETHPELFKLSVLGEVFTSWTKSPLGQVDDSINRYNRKPVYGQYEHENIIYRSTVRVDDFVSLKTGKLTPVLNIKLANDMLKIAFSAQKWRTRDNFLDSRYVLSPEEVHQVFARHD